MDDLAARISWAIEVIKTDPILDKGITDIDLAKKLGTNENTLAAYRKKQGLLKGMVLENLAICYNFNPFWLLRGYGEPFPGARLKYPDMCGPDHTTNHSSVKENVASYNAPISTTPVTPQDYRISDALSMCARVLESGTSYATALHLNIQHFDRAISAESRIAHVEQNYIKMEAENTKMKIELANIKLEVDKLKENTREINDKVAKEMAT